MNWEFIEESIKMISDLSEWQDWSDRSDTQDRRYDYFNVLNKKYINVLLKIRCPCSYNLTCKLFVQEVHYSKCLLEELSELLNRAFRSTKLKDESSPRKQSKQKSRK